MPSAGWIFPLAHFFSSWFGRHLKMEFFFFYMAVIWNVKRKRPPCFSSSLLSKISLLLFERGGSIWMDGSVCSTKRSLSILTIRYQRKWKWKRVWKRKRDNGAMISEMRMVWSERGAVVGCVVLVGWGGLVGCTYCELREEYGEQRTSSWEAGGSLFVRVQVQSFGAAIWAKAGQSQSGWAATKAFWRFTHTDRNQRGPRKSIDQLTANSRSSSSLGRNKLIRIRTP